MFFHNIRIKVGGELAKQLKAQALKSVKPDLSPADINRLFS